MTEKDDIEDQGPYQHGGLSAWLGRVVVTLLIIAVILYVGMIVISRTEGIESIVEERLGAELGVTLAVETLKLDFDLALMATGIASLEEGDAQTPKIRAERLRIVWMPQFLRRGRIAAETVEIDGASVILERDDKGVWSPESLFSSIAMLTRWIEWEVPVANRVVPVQSEGDDSTEEPSSVRRLNEVLGKQVRWVLSDASVLWRESNGMAIAEVAGLNVEVTPLQTPSRTLTHWMIAVRKRRAMGVPIEDADIELLSRSIDEDAGIEVALISNQKKK